MAKEILHGGKRDGAGRHPGAPSHGQGVRLADDIWQLRDALAEQWKCSKREAMERAIREAAQREGIPTDEVEQS